MALKITPRQKKICPDWPPQKLSLDCIVLQFSMTLTCGAQSSKAKVQLISEAIFYGFPLTLLYSKKSTKFLQVSDLDSKMGQIREIQAIYYINYTLITNYRVSHIEMCDCKWFWGEEGSIILLIFLSSLNLIFHTSSKGWPPQPLKERVPNIIEKFNF